MSPARRPAASESQNYFISFTDLLVGVLFIFLLMIMAYALNGSSEREARKTFERKISLLEGRVKLRRALLETINTGMTARGFRDVEINYDDGVIRFRSDQFFDTGRAELKPGARGLLNALSAVMAEKIPCYVDRAPCTNGMPILEAIYVEGHTDRQPNRLPDGGDGNWPLSSARAQETFRYLTGRAPLLGGLVNVSGKKLLSISAYAATRELEPAMKSPRNRRIEVRFLLAAPRQEDLARARQALTSGASQ